MTPSERFLKFAADCKSMAKMSDDPNSGSLWHTMAERWMHCAEWAERENSVAQRLRARRRDRKST
jgi:hypothetical protein